MKKIITTLSICIFYIALGYAQENEKIVVKGDFIQINMKGITTADNFARRDINKVLIRKSSILSVVMKENVIIIGTSEISWNNHVTTSKLYEFKFSDTDSIENFYLNLVDKITAN